MTLISTIIADAYRETNLIARGSTPSTGEQEEGLRLLDRYIESLFGNEVGDNLEDQLFGNNSNIDTSTYNNNFENFVKNWFLPDGYRLKLNLSSAETIKLDPNPEDGARFGIVDASNNLSTYNLTIDGNGSRIEGATDLVLSTDGSSDTWFYRADEGDWKRVTNLALDSESPFPKEFDDVLIIGLAMRLSPRNGPGLKQETVSHYQRILSKFRARYSQVQQKPVEWALLELNRRNRRYNRRYSFNGEFERGSIFRW